MKWHSPPSLQKTFGAGWFHTTSENETYFVSMHHKFLEFITHKTYENNWKYEFLLNQHTYYSYYMKYYMTIFLYNISYMQSGAGYLHHYRTSPPKKGSSGNPVLRRRWPPWSGPLALSRWPMMWRGQGGTTYHLFPRGQVLTSNSELRH